MITELMFKILFFMLLVLTSFLKWCIIVSNKTIEVIMDSVDFRQLFLFRGIEQKAAQIMKSLPYRTVLFSAGEEICTKDRFEKALAFILSGEAVVYRRSEQKNGNVRLNRLLPGDSFGASVLFSDGDDFPTDLLAVKDTEILLIPQAAVEDLFVHHPETAINYIAFLSGRIRFLNKKIDSFSGRTAEAKIAAYLLHTQKAGSLYISNYTNVAKSLSVGRATLYRILDMFSEKSLLKRDGSTVILLDINELERISHS